MKKIILFLVIIATIGISGYYFYAFKIKKIKSDNYGMNIIRVGYTEDSLTSAAVSIAYEKEYFKKHNLSVEMIPLKNGKEVAQAMAAGQIDTGMGGIANFSPAMAKGAPMRFVAASSASPSYIFVRPQSGIESFEDLYGKTVSVAANGINDLIFRTAMSKEGIDTSRMKFVEIERAYNVAALMGKKAADAAVVADQDTDAFFQAGAVILSEWETAGYSSQAEPRNSLVVDTNFLNQHESVVHDFIGAYIDAHRFIKENPQEAAEILAERIKKISSGAVVRLPEEIVEQWEGGKTVNMLWQDPAITIALVKKSKEIGSIDKELSLEEVYDLRFEKELQEAQNEIYGK